MTYVLNKKIDETGLRIGITYFMFDVSDSMAFTRKSQIKITGLDYVEGYAQYSDLIKVRFRIGQQRKDRMLFLKDCMLFLETTTDLPVDTDFNSFSGNALINFVTEDPDNLRQFILDTNRYAFANLGKITFCSEQNDRKTMLFPECADTSHAVVRRMMEVVMKT